VLQVEKGYRWESMIKYAKSFKSVPKTVKVWQSVLRVDKVKTVKVWQSVLRVDKVKTVKVRQSVLKVDKVFRHFLANSKEALN